MPMPNNQPPGRKRPNLLYIHSDQHGAQTLGCYGDANGATPNLDRIANAGVRFTNAYCASPICVASRMAMLTGLHPYQTEVWCNNHSLNSGIPTLAHSLGSAGLRPVLSGRMHSVGPDQLRGYVDRFVGDHNPNHLGGRSPGRGQLDGAAGPNRAAIDKSGIGRCGYQQHDQEVTDAALAFLQRHRDQQSTEPFCLTVGYMLPHAPFVAPREAYLRYADVVGLPRIQETPTHPFIAWWRQRAGIEDLSEKDILRCRSAYWALVDQLDREIGRLLEYLDTHGLTEDTLIIYTSDHGEMAGEHGLWWKHVFYENSVRVPFLLSWPKVLPAGMSIDQVISAQDVTATLLDAMQAPRLPGSTGRSVLPLLTDSSARQSWENLAFAEYCNDEEFSPPEGCFQRMIRRDSWKLIYYHGQPCQLFDLTHDPDETHDLANDPRHRETLQSLLEEVLSDWHPDTIKQALQSSRNRAAILTNWGRRTEPEPVLQWKLTDDMNVLESLPYPHSRSTH